MSTYMTEEEQLEAIKKWWRKYSSIITVTLSLIFLSFAGLKYWHWHQNKITMQASTLYEHLMLASSNQDTQAMQSYANQLTKQYNRTIYADAARMTLAKFFVTQDQYKEAKDSLEYVVRHSKMSALKQVAKIRIARLYAEEKAYTKALSELASVEDDVYMPIVNELKGDIYKATGKYQQAMASYKKAILEVRTNGVGNVFLEMKTNELAALTQSMKEEGSPFKTV